MPNSVEQTTPEPRRYDLQTMKTKMVGEYLEGYIPPIIDAWSDVQSHPGHLPLLSSRLNLFRNFPDFRTSQTERSIRLYICLVPQPPTSIKGVIGVRQGQSYLF